MPKQPREAKSVCLLAWEEPDSGLGLVRGWSLRLRAIARRFLVICKRGSGGQVVVGVDGVGARSTAACKDTWEGSVLPYLTTRAWGARGSARGQRKKTKLRNT